MSSLAECTDATVRLHRPRTAGLLDRRRSRIAAGPLSSLPAGPFADRAATGATTPCADAADPRRLTSILHEAHRLNHPRRDFDHSTSVVCGRVLRRGIKPLWRSLSPHAVPPHECRVCCVGAPHRTREPLAGPITNVPLNAGAHSIPIVARRLRFSPFELDTACRQPNRPIPNR